MILSWMISALLFSTFVAVSASAAEAFARALHRPRRWIWITALATGALWPLIATFAIARFSAVPRLLPSIRVLPDDVALGARLAPRTLDVVELTTLCLWALATTLLVVRLVRGIVALRRVRDGAEARRVDGTTVLVTESVGPATIGLRRHNVIVPRMFLDLEEPLRRMVLRHEREHCEARDPWVLLGAAVVLVLFPWNAALWFIARRLHLALEIDCDTRVLADGADPIRYGELLLLMAQRRSAVAFAPMLAAVPSHLERRIIAMQTRLKRPRPLRLAGAGLLLALGVAGACSEGTPSKPLARMDPMERPLSALSPTTAEQPYFEFQVETPAEQIPATGKLSYPSAMRLANIEGEVLVQFVVGVDGAPELKTFKVLASSDAAFTTAVAQALPTMRFTPARVGGAAVRQLVQMPFTFGLTSHARRRPVGRPAIRHMTLPQHSTQPTTANR